MWPVIIIFVLYTVFIFAHVITFFLSFTPPAQLGFSLELFFLCLKITHSITLVRICWWQFFFKYLYFPFSLEGYLWKVYSMNAFKIWPFIFSSFTLLSQGVFPFHIYSVCSSEYCTILGLFFIQYGSLNKYFISSVQ